MEWLTDWLFVWFYETLLTLQTHICLLIDFMREVFYKLGGLNGIEINGEQQDILFHFLLSENVKTAFLGVLLIGIILIVVFTIISIIRAEAQDEQRKKSKGHILSKAGQALILYLIIPFVLIAAITLTNSIMQAINNSMSVVENGTASLGSQIFITAAYDAFIGNADERLKIEELFLSGQLKFYNLIDVKKYYSLSMVNYFLGIVSGIIILFTFALAVIKFIQRLFDVVMLFIISPISISTLSVDDGARYKIWRELIISKILGAYGIVLSMNLFFMIIPQIRNISFFDNSFENGVVYILFIIGGSLAVSKANLVIAQLTGSTAGNQEAQQMIAGFHTSVRMGKAVATTVAGVSGRILGGSNFIANRKHGAGYIENLTATFKSKTNCNQVNGEKTMHTKRQVASGALRLATLPIGVLKDLVQGGVITVGKNIIPRMRNVISGTSLINHADIKKHADIHQDNKGDSK